MRHGWLSVIAATLLLLVAAPTASATHQGRYVPAGLDQTVESTHFLIHYDDATYTLARAEALSDDFEEAHSRLVSGAGGTPNAGLAAPPDDGDLKTDVYISRPTAPGWDTFSGGVVFGDGEHFSSYVFMTPDQQPGPARFRAAHEYMHVIQRAYFGGSTLLTESTANWAAEWALPDIDPRDAFFSAPFLPLDCSYGTWPPGGGSAPKCGNGYWQWTFMWRLSQRFGVGIIDRLFDEVAADCPYGCTPAQDRATLADVIDAQAGSDTLGGLYAEYARDVWVPARWNTGPLPTTAMQSIHTTWGDPVATTVTAGVPGEDTGNVGVVVDHLSTRYVRIRNDGSFGATGPNDLLRIGITRPAGQTAPFHALARLADGSLVDTPEPTGGVIDLGADAADLREVILPISNDSVSDGQAFAYRARWLRADPTPPGNDTAAGAVPIARGVEASASNVYAGGRGNVDEATSCPLITDATRGVWFRFTTENHGVHTYSAQASDFDAVIALYDHDTGAFAGCDSTGVYAGEQSEGRTLDVYVGRRAGDTAFGTTARLVVNGPAAGPPELDVTTPAPGAVLSVAKPTFAGTAGTRAADGSTITVKIWQGNDVSAPPVQTLTTERTGSTWQVEAASALANGSYVWRAEQESSHGTGVSEYRALGISVPSTTTGTGTGTGGGAGTGAGGGTGARAPDGSIIPGPIGGEPVVDDEGQGPSTACVRARTAYASAKLKVTAAKKALKRAKGAKRRKAANKKLKRARTSARRALAQRRRFCGVR
ncbi:MAG TPA: hypothetical protein VF549_02280 [Solirubrobacteraceae bacterium]